MGIRVEDKLNALENDVDFQTLIQKYRVPNCVSIMGKTRREEWHSNFVNWLLDPQGNHNMGTYPLEKFLDLIEMKNNHMSIDRTNLVSMEFQTEFPVQIKKKQGRVDVYGQNEFLIIVIENKLKSKENECQSDLYYDFFESEYKIQQKCYVHLTSEPQNRLVNENFILITYQDLYDYVIKHVVDKCIDLDNSDTQNVLEQYITDISNPLLGNSVMAYTEREKARKIYQSHKNTIGIIWKTMGNLERDEDSEICKFYKRCGEYINELILKPLGEPEILPETGEKLEGRALIGRLVRDGYVIRNETELIYTRHGGTYIIKINEDYTCRAGFCSDPNYNGSGEVRFLTDGENIASFKDIREAAVEIEWAIHPHPSKSKKEANGGKSPYYMKFCKAGEKLRKDTTIRKLYPKWFVPRN